MKAIEEEDIAAPKKAPPRDINKAREHLKTAEAFFDMDKVNGDIGMDSTDVSLQVKAAVTAMLPKQHSAIGISENRLQDKIESYLEERVKIKQEIGRIPTMAELHSLGQLGEDVLMMTKKYVNICSNVIYYIFKN